MTKTTRLVFLFILFTGTVFTYSCSKSHSSGATVCSKSVSFSADMLPLLNQHCNSSGCHDDNNAAALNNFQVVHDGASQIKASVLAGRMPRNGTLTTAQKQVITCWVDNGALNN